MSAYEKNVVLADRIRRASGVEVSIEQANTLRRAERTLRRWAELECGDSNDYGSWAIERDEETLIPHMCFYCHSGGVRRHRVADREAGALRRVTAVCAAVGLHFCHQTDPRGYALYVSREPLTNSDYTRGVACAV